MTDLSSSSTTNTSGLEENNTNNNTSLLFPREAETFGSVDVVPGGAEKLHPGFTVRKFELRTRRYGRRIGSGGSGGNGGPRVVFLVSLQGGEGGRHPRTELDLLRCVRVVASLRKSTAFKTLVLPG